MFISENKSLIDKIKTKLIGLFDIPDGRPDSPVAIRPEEIPKAPDSPKDDSFPGKLNDRKEPGMYLSQDIHKILSDIKAKEQDFNFNGTPYSNEYKEHYMTPPEAELLSPPKEENNDLDLS